MRSTGLHRRSVLLGALSVVVAMVSAATPAVATGGAAPGGPGAPAVYQPADKQAFGTAHGGAESPVWFTLGGGRMTEVFYPDLSTPAVRDLQLVVTDGKTFTERAQDVDVRTEPVSDGGLTFRQLARGTGWRAETHLRHRPGPGERARGREPAVAPAAAGLRALRPGPVPRGQRRQRHQRGRARRLRRGRDECPGRRQRLRRHVDGLPRHQRRLDRPGHRPHDGLDLRQGRSGQRRADRQAQARRRPPRPRHPRPRLRQEPRPRPCVPPTARWTPGSARPRASTRRAGRTTSTA